MLALRLTRSDEGTAFALASETSINGWLPGEIKVSESFDLPDNIKPGRYELAIGVVDPDTENPSVRLAIAGRDEDGWYPLSAIEVK